MSRSPTTQEGDAVDTVRCGIITPRTQISFMSRSSRAFWLIQLSRETWDFSIDGQLNFERLLGRVLTPALAKCAEDEHHLTIVLFARVWDTATTYSISGRDDGPYRMNADGSYQQQHDHFMVVFEGPLSKEQVPNVIVVVRPKRPPPLTALRHVRRSSTFQRASAGCLPLAVSGGSPLAKSPRPHRCSPGGC